MSKSQIRYPVLEKLFNSRLRIKVLKFLFRNGIVKVGPRDLSRRIQEPADVVIREMKNLEKIGVVEKD